MEAWSFDSRRFGRGEARLEVGEGGGGGGELLCARDRSKATGGRRSKGGAAAACSARALAQRGRRELSGNKINIRRR